ncbi:protein DBF4 homolog A isoform X2 [Pseudophryne corroboree]
MNDVYVGPKVQRCKGGTPQGRGVKMKPCLPRAKPLPDKGPAQKPFTGKVFYLDVTSALVAEKLEKDIKELGGTVEGFLSKEITYLITNKKEAKCAKTLKFTSMPSPESGQNPGIVSARPSTHKAAHQEGGSSKKPEKDDVSRGKSLLKKAMKETKILQKNSILANALNWGVRILHVEEAKIYIEQKKRSLQQVKQSEASAKPVVKRPVRRKVKAQKLSSPFIKVEDSSCQYRPLYLVPPHFRSFQSPISKPCYSVDKKAVAAPKETDKKQSVHKTWHGQDGGNNSHFKVREEKKRGYCECCLQKYDDLDAHLVSQQHKTYAQGPYYQDVDNLISSFEFDFVDWSQCRQDANSDEALLPAVIIKQEEKEIPPISDHTFQNMPSNNIPEPDVVKETEVNASQDLTCTVLNTVRCSEPISAFPCTVQPVCLATCLADSPYKQPGAPIITPCSETLVSPVPMDETGNVLIVYNTDGSQKDMLPQETNTQRLTEWHPPEAAKAIQNTFSDSAVVCPSKKIKLAFSDSAVVCPSKKIKLDDSLDLLPLCSRTLEAEQMIGLPPSGISVYNEDMETSCPSKLFEALPSQGPHCSPSKLHGNVKALVCSARRQEDVHYNPRCKISVPVEQYEFSSSKERLVAMFESSNVQSEFYGFCCSSLDSPSRMEDTEDRPSSHRNILWSMFSHTGSSACTFNGF